MVPLSSTRNAVPELGLDSAPAGSNRVDRTTTAVNSAATARDETAVIHEEFEGDSRVVLVCTRAASRTEGSLEELVISQTCYRGPFTPLGWQNVGPKKISQPAGRRGIHRFAQITGGAMIVQRVSNASSSPKHAKKGRGGRQCTARRIRRETRTTSRRTRSRAPLARRCGRSPSVRASRNANDKIPKPNRNLSWIPGWNFGAWHSWHPAKCQPHSLSEALHRM